MARERKSPQEKKQLAYTKDHFTGGFNSSRMFPKGWKRKKSRVNREYRRKSDEILASAKTGIDSTDVESIAQDWTAERFQKSVARKRLHRVGTVSLHQKVQDKLERRAEAIGRNVERHQTHDLRARNAATTLSALEGDAVSGVVRRVDLICCRRNTTEVKRVMSSDDPVDHALYFLYLVCMGSAYEIDALRRNPDVDRVLELWLRKANRMLDRDRHALEQNKQEKRAAKNKIKNLR